MHSLWAALENNTEIPDGAECGGLSADQYKEVSACDPSFEEVAPAAITFHA